MSRKDKTLGEIVESADTNFQVWCRRTELATIVLWYESQGINIRSRSGLGKMILEDFVTMIAKSGFEVVRETSEAVGILRERGLGDLNVQGKGERVLLSKLQLESSRPIRRSEITPEVVEEAIRKFKETQIGAPVEQDYSIENLKKVLRTTPNNVVKDEEVQDEK